MPLAPAGFVLLQTNTGVSTTDTLTFTLAAGTTYIVRAAINSSTKVFSSLTDDLGGNAWAVDRTQQASASSTSIGSCKAVTGGTATLTITYTSAVSGNITYMVVASPELNGVKDVPISDSSAGGGTTTNMTSGPTGVLNHPDEIAVAVGATSLNPGTFTPIAGWTDESHSSSARFQQQVVVTTASLTAGGTYTTPRNNSCCLVTYAGTPAAPVFLPAPPHAALQAVSRSSVR